MIALKKKSTCQGDDDALVVSCAMIISNTIIR